MVNQIGFPTLFFTLSAADTKWLDLHAIMPSSASMNTETDLQSKIQNIIQYPHLVVIFMHHRFISFH